MTVSLSQLLEDSFQIAWEYLERSGELGDGASASRFLSDVIETMVHRGQRSRLALSNRAISASKIDDAGRVTEAASVFEAPDDATAIIRARALIGNCGRIEIWEKSRQVALIKLDPGNSRHHSKGRAKSDLPQNQAARAFENAFARNPGTLIQAMCNLYSITPVRMRSGVYPASLSTARETLAACPVCFPTTRRPSPAIPRDNAS
jgi:hypothetical protein